MAPLRRGLGDSEDDFEDEDEGDDSSGSEFWKIKVKPAPEGLKGVLKREGSFEVTKMIVDGGKTQIPEVKAGIDEEKAKLSSTLSPIPSPSASITSSSDDNSFYSPPLPSPSPAPVLEPTLSSQAEEPLKPKPKKSVSIQEPSLVELEALRELWSSPEMQSTVNGGNGFGGIAGYRRTRDHYARGQGGRGVNKSTPPVVVTSTPSTTPATKPTPAIPKKEEIIAKDKPEEDEGSPRPRRPLNSSLARSSSSSLSPSPITRRPIGKRALSPNSNGIVVSSSATSKRRGLSPNNVATSGSSPLRSSSSSPAPSSSSDRVQPRWIKTKKASKSTPRTVSNDEEDEERGTGRNGTMSATVSDDEDDYEDVPPTPPSQPSLTLAMAPISSSSDSPTNSPSKISPSLALLLDHATQSLVGDELPSEESPSTLSDSQISQLPTPSPSPTLSPASTPSFSITPATPDLPSAALPPPSTDPWTRSSVNSAEEEDEEEDPNDPMSSPTVEAKGTGTAPSELSSAATEKRKTAERKTKTENLEAA
ncbi:uncharacterized protein JCM6883_005154 [Sporobolomyces salmoneus]|uniref:uncharacterized protein n=1 Tax=Sporobolomyces salmoneus TaxID=183962 RepID=UPI003180D2CB